MWVKERITNICRPGQVFAEAGEQVKIVADYGNVAIVESNKGIRFAANKSLLTEENIEAAPDTAVQTTIINRAPVSKKAAPLKKQKTLF